ncbi:Phosphoglucosamine mutase [hydrothermal vent metagenome]|uniref:Phosphoglucosamine mutase n=1 Tax=hydrothermal vent metagenome TaxID=652676 RepID=A0A1W1C9S5_9ZZZZ
MGNYYFGTDGIRGKVGTNPITAEFFLKLGWAVGVVLKKTNKNANVIIGKDTRASGYMFESALEAGFISAGVDVGLLGPMPTPAIAYLTKAYGATAGVVISASHNNHQDNGVKFFNHLGFKLSSKQQKEIEKQLSKPIKTVIADEIGKAERKGQAIGRYIEFCKSTLKYGMNFNNIHIVLDCANGATYHIAPFVFKELGAKVTIINNTPNGFNINENCGATNTRNLQAKVIETNADLGIALDGDGDRLIIIDKNGELVDGDEIVFIIAKYWKDNKLLNKNTIVGTQMSNLGMRKSLEKLGIKFIESKVGDRFVMEEMTKNNLILGGEGSGHIICLNYATTGDGIISALKILEIITQTKQTINELKSVMNKYPQTLINVELKDKKFNPKDEVLLKEIKAIEEKLKDEGRILIRPSGTEPLVRVMVEGKDASLVRKSAERLAKVI